MRSKKTGVKNCRINIRAKFIKFSWLTSEDLGCWGRDINLTLPDLLNELVKVIPEDGYMRLGLKNSFLTFPS